MIDHNVVVNSLRNVKDPKSGQDIITAKLVEDFKVEGNNIYFSIVLKSNDSELKSSLNFACMEELSKVYPNAQVHIHQKVNEASDKASVLPQVKNVIAIASGKGGVGKSTVSANLALALAEGGASVGLMDADIYGPSVPIMFGVRGERPMMKEVDGKGVIIPLDKYGIKLMSIGLLVDEKNAVVWRGPMASSAIKQFVTDVDWGELDYLIIDMPPGTGDIHLTLMQTVPVTGVVIVTTPQNVALADARKGIAMFGQAQINVPIIGLVENMAYFTPAELPNNKYYLFGKEGGKFLADEYDLSFLGQVPLVQSIREGGDDGVPAMIGNDEISKQAFRTVTAQAVRNIAVRNANMPKTKEIEVVA